MLQVDPYRTLIAVDQIEVTPLIAGVVTLAGIFDLDDVSAHICQMLGTQGAGQQPGKIENTDSVQRRFAHGDWQWRVIRSAWDQDFNSSRSLNNARVSGLASASLFFTGSPCTTLRTASSTILPLFVLGMSAT